MKIVSYKIDDLELDPENARRHGDVDLAAIKASLSQFGQMTPIVVSVSGDRPRVVKGNGTLMAATALGWSEIAVIETTLEGEELRAYAIADNRTSDLSEWDLQKLVDQLGNLDEELQLAAGFTEAELIAMMEQIGEPNFEPGTEDDQGKLDELQPKMVTCPKCSQEFNIAGMKF